MRENAVKLLDLLKEKKDKNNICVICNYLMAVELNLNERTIQKLLLELENNNKIERLTGLTRKIKVL